VDTPDALDYFKSRLTQSRATASRVCGWSMHCTTIDAQRRADALAFKIEIW
jgi:hypothetical protein